MGNTFKKKQRKNSNSNSDKLINISTTNYNKTHSKSNSDNYKEYFKLIRHKLVKFYEENQHNQFNISLCLDKRDFNTVSTAKKISINPNQKFVYWKDFLLQFLNKQMSKGVIWARDLSDLIKGEIFLSENKWLSLFFWQEFEMRTKPKCLNIVSTNNKNSDKDQSLESCGTDKEMPIITDRLNGSFVSINTNSLSLNDPTHEYKEYRNKVKAYINIFKEHVFDSDHPINIVSKFFARVFSVYILDKMKELYTMRNSNNPNFNKSATIISNEITKSLQKFILKLQTALRLMYSKTINYQCFIEEKDEFINLITNLLFRDGKLYNYVYDLFKISLYDQMKVLENKFLDLRKLKPEELGIHEKFCLNGVTLNFQKILLEQNKTNLKKNNNLIKEKDKMIINNNNCNESMSLDRKDLLRKVDDQLIEVQDIRDSYNEYNEFTPNSNVTMKLNIKESIASHEKLNPDIELSKTPSKEIRFFSESDILKKSIQKVSPKSGDKFHAKFKNIQNSYESAVKLLKTLSKYKVPFEKMMLIATISSEITECVNVYWKDFEKVITSSLLNIDADELMTIFIFIIIKSQMSELLIHSKFIKEFTTSTTRSSMMGYYFTTIEASLIYILSIKDISDLVNRDNIKQSLIPNKTSFIEHDYDDFTVLAINSNLTNNKN